MNDQSSIQSCRSGSALDERTGIQLCIARAVWQAHIQHAGELAPNVALEGKTAACVATWFSRHSELVLNTTLRRTTLQVPESSLTYIQFAGHWMLLIGHAQAAGQ